MKLKHLLMTTILIGQSTLAYSNNDIDGLEKYNADTQVSHQEKAGKLLTTDWFTSPRVNFRNLTKEEKLLAVNVAGIAFVAFVGLSSWDYGSAEKIYTKDEGWFGDKSSTKYGGADKLGHAWSTYAFADVLSGFYQDWGYSRDKASLYGAISSWIVMGIMEVGDGTSADHGFSKEDMIMNSIGAATSYLLGQFPELDAILDFRIQYELNTTPGDIMTDYENLTYLAAIKLEGFKFIHNEILKMMEIHVGYNTRGYKIDYEDGHTERNLYFGVNFNFSKLFRDKGYRKTSRLLEYIQIPYTSHGVGVNFDDEDKDVKLIFNGPQWNEDADK